MALPISHHPQLQPGNRSKCLPCGGFWEGGGLGRTVNGESILGDQRHSPSEQAELGPGREQTQTKLGLRGPGAVGVPHTKLKPNLQDKL